MYLLFSDKCPFSNVVETEKPYEISRKFLATLQLANSGNVTIEQSRNDDGSSEFDDVNLTLLSKQRVCYSLVSSCMLRSMSLLQNCLTAQSCWWQILTHRMSLPFFYSTVVITILLI